MTSYHLANTFLNKKVNKFQKIIIFNNIMNMYSKNFAISKWAHEFPYENVNEPKEIIFAQRNIWLNVCHLTWQIFIFSEGYTSETLLNVR